MYSQPACLNASATDFACSGHKSGKIRRTGMRPSLPCHGPSKSMSRSTFLKYGSTLSQFQPVAQRRPGGAAAADDVVVDIPDPPDVPPAVVVAVPGDSRG